MLIRDVFLLIGKVRHSYAISQTPLKPLVIMRKNGTVEYGHCICMVGLAETCSHIAAILYWLETTVLIHSETSCTSNPNSWLPQSMLSTVEQVPYIKLEALEDLADSSKRLYLLQDNHGLTLLVKLQVMTNWKASSETSVQSLTGSQLYSASYHPIMKDSLNHLTISHTP